MWKEDFAFFDAGGVTLALSGELGVREATPAGCEFVFGVPSVMEAFVALRSRIDFVNKPRAVNEANWAVNFCDPDGRSLSFYGPK